MKSIVRFSFLIFVLVSTAKATELCSTEVALQELGWIIHQESDFAEVYSRVEQLRYLPDMVEDLELNFDSESLNKTVHFQSWDSLSTYDLEMYGDLVYYSDVETRKVFEIRWYEGNSKHLVHQGIECTSDDIPLAENALF